jgi:hypothetical protein
MDVFQSSAWLVLGWEQFSQVEPDKPKSEQADDQFVANEHRREIELGGVGCTLPSDGQHRDCISEEGGEEKTNRLERFAE